MQIVKVRYYSETTEALSEREYSYFSVDELKVGDVVMVPVKDTTGKAQVSAIGVPEAEIQHFLMAVKTIPAGSICPPAPQTIPFPLEEKPAPSSSSNAIIEVNPKADIIFVGYQQEVAKILKYAQGLTVANDAEQKSATNDLAMVARVKKGVEEQRQLYVKPLNEHLKSINDAFKQLSDPIASADAAIRQKINAYRADVEMRRIEAEAINREKEALAKREAALNQGVITIDTTPVVVPDAPAAHVRAEAGTLGTAKVWKWEVVDFHALDDDYKLPDTAKIGKAVRAGVHIPGIKAWQESSLRITT